MSVFLSEHICTLYVHVELICNLLLPSLSIAFSFKPSPICLKLFHVFGSNFVDANQNHLCENFVTYNPKYILRKASKIIISLAAFTIHII